MSGARIDLTPAERYAQLERLARLRDEGVLSEAEFAAEKAKLLVEPPGDAVAADPGPATVPPAMAAKRLLWIVPVALLVVALIVVVVRGRSAPEQAGEGAALTAAPPVVAPASAPMAVRPASEPTRPTSPHATSAATLTISPAASRPAVTDADWVQMVPATANVSADGICDRPVLEKQVTSLDGGYVYQQVCHWAVSSDIIQVRRADGRRKEVTPGNSLAVIRDGPYRGYLLVAKHRYRPAMDGSYDATFVIRPDGHETLMVPGSDSDDDQAVARWLTQQGWHAS